MFLRSWLFQWNHVVWEHVFSTLVKEIKLSFKPTHISLSPSLITITSSSQLQYELVCFDELVTEIFHLPPAWMTRYDRPDKSFCSPPPPAALMALLLRASWQNVLSFINFQRFREENSGGIKPESCHQAACGALVLFVLQLSSLVWARCLAGLWQQPWIRKW